MPSVCCTLPVAGPRQVLHPFPPQTLPRKANHPGCTPLPNILGQNVTLSLRQAALSMKVTVVSNGSSYDLFRLASMP